MSQGGSLKLQTHEKILTTSVLVLMKIHSGRSTRASWSMRSSYVEEESSE